MTHPCTGSIVQSKSSPFTEGCAITVEAKAVFCRTERANNQGRRSVQWSLRDHIEGFRQWQVRHNSLCREHVGSIIAAQDCT